MIKTTTVHKQSSFTYDQPKSLLQRFLKALSGHVGLLVCVTLFTIIGAYAFMAIETPQEEHRYLVKRLRAKDIEDTINYVAQLFWYEKHQNITEKQWDKRMRDTLNIFETQIINAVNEHRYDGKEMGWNYDWSFAQAFLFTCSIVTTLGYGHIVPRTDTGQIFTIVYAMIGIPLTLIFLARIGDLMASSFRRVYSRFCCNWCRKRRYKSEARFGRKPKRVWEDEVGHEEYMPTDLVRVPVAIVMVVMLLYLLLGAAIFSCWEGWSFVSAVYFSFVTLTTIGFGDLVPGNSFFSTLDSVTRAWQMVTAIAYCLLGMALVSMCIQMVQDQAADTVRWVGEELGIIEDHLRPRLKYRRSRPGTVPVCNAAPRAKSAVEYAVVIDEFGNEKRVKQVTSASRKRSKLCRQKIVMESGASVEGDIPATSDHTEEQNGDLMKEQEANLLEKLEVAEKPRGWGLMREKVHELGVDEVDGQEEKTEREKSAPQVTSEENEPEEEVERLFEEEMNNEDGEEIEEHKSGKRSELDKLIEEEMDSAV